MSNLVKPLMSVLLVCLLSCACFGDIYRSTDVDGNIVLSDMPHDGAAKISSPKSQSYSSDQTAPGLAHGQLTLPMQREERPVDDKLVYQLVAILKPQQQETLRSRVVTVLVNIKPALFTGDLIELHMDGQKVASSDKSYHFSIHNVDRGTHTISAHIIRANEQVVASSAKIAVHVQLPHISTKPPTANKKAISAAISTALSHNRQVTNQASNHD